MRCANITSRFLGEVTCDSAAVSCPHGLTKHRKSQNRVCRVSGESKSPRMAFRVLAPLLFLLVAACGQQSTDEASAELVQLLDDFRAAVNDYDGEAVQALVTDDYVSHESYYDWVGSQLLFSPGNIELDEVLAGLEGYLALDQYQYGDVGAASVFGDGPWYVTQYEEVTSVDYEYQGTAVYVVEDQEGTLRLAAKSWTGIRSVPAIGD